MADNMNSQDPVQHGIDDNPSGDAQKGAALGGLGGAAVGAAAGAMAGPVGMVVGAVIGGLSGAGASGLAVAAVDKVDNDNTVSGLGDGSTTKGGAHVGGQASEMGASGSGLPGASLAESGLMGGASSSAPLPGAPIGSTTTSGGTLMANDMTPGNNIPGGQTTAGADTRGMTEKLADTATGDRTDDKTGGQVAGGAMGTGAYGTYQGRNISRSEYDKLSEADRMRVQLIAETLHVNKDMRQTGEVEVSKHVVSEQVQVPVTLQHEEVVVTRRTVDQAVDATTAGKLFQDETIKVPVHEEVAVVTKEARIAEEIEIEKRAVSQQQTVSDTVRHEELDVQGNPADRVRTEGDAKNPRRS